MTLTRKAILLCSLCLTSPSLSAAQSGRVPEETRPRRTASGPRCALNLSQAPAPLGLRLGMSLPQVLARFPVLKVSPPNELGVSSAYLEDLYLSRRPISDPGFRDVTNVALEFTDGRLSYLRLGYKVTNSWNSMDQFLSSVATWLDLSGEWDHFYDLEDKNFRDIEDFRDKALECEGFRVSAGIGVEGIGEQTPHIKLEDTVAAEMVRAREDAKSRREAEQQRPAGNP